MDASNLVNDPIVEKAARERGLTVEKFIERIRAISSGREVCAHSTKSRFFRRESVRT